MSLKSHPKLELHLHLEGAAPPGFIRGLAKEKHVDISGIFPKSISIETVKITIILTPQHAKRPPN